MVGTLHATVTARMIGVGGDFSDTKNLVEDVRKLGAELEAVVRKGTTRTPSKRTLPVDKNVGRALSFKFSGGDSEHVRAAAKTVGENPGARRIEMTGQRTVNRGAFRAWDFRQSGSGAATNEFKRSFLCSSRNVRACEVYMTCRDGRNQSNGRLV